MYPNECKRCFRPKHGSATLPCHSRRNACLTRSAGPNTGARPYQSQAKARCAAIGALRGLHAADEEFAFEDEFLREMSV
jgi:hypothetical protein